jgi:hypothetical protein
MVTDSLEEETYFVPFTQYFVIHDAGRLEVDLLQKEYEIRVTLPPMSNQPMRPLGLGEIIDTAFKIYTRHWRALLLLVAVVMIPAGIASYLILNDAVPANLVEQLNDPNPVLDEALLRDMLRFLGAAVLAALIQSGAAMLASAASVRAVAEIYLGNQPDWRASLTAAARRLPAILATGLLIAVGLGVLSAGVWLLAAVTASTSTGAGALAALSIIAWLVVVPWLAISWTPAFPVLMIEGTSPPAALARSFHLVRGRWWPTFGTLLTTWLIVAVLSGIASRIIEAFLPGGGGVVSGVAISVAVAVATTPFAVAVLAVLYLDLRTRREPFDLGRLADDIGAPRPINPPEIAGPRAPDRADWPPLPPGGDGSSTDE